MIIATGQRRLRSVVGVHTDCAFPVVLPPSGNNGEGLTIFVAAVMKEYNVVPGFYTASTYVAAMQVEAALNLIKGRVEDKPAFVKALHEARLDASPVGPIRIEQMIVAQRVTLSCGTRLPCGRTISTRSPKRGATEMRSSSRRLTGAWE